MAKLELYDNGGKVPYTMSRKITELSINAFLRGTPFKKSNMEVRTFYIEETGNTVVTMWLHGYSIARYYLLKDGSKTSIEITDAGWRTLTTKEILNGLPGVSIVQKKGVWYLNGRKLDKEDYESYGYGSRLKWTQV